MACRYLTDGFCTTLLVAEMLCAFHHAYDECEEYLSANSCQDCGADLNLEECQCEDICIECSQVLSMCECCPDCGCEYCECCEECGYYICECCQDCARSDCICEEE